MQDQVKNIHFVGIGGVGMAGIAEVCLNLGYLVTGSDVRRSPAVIRLEGLGANIQIGHNPDLVQQAEVLVVSSAINDANFEVQWAREQRIPVIPRAEMLAELMRMRFGIAIAGTHGKTTTTSLTAAILTEAGLDPTFVIGGKLNQVGSNARLGSGKYLVAEADESDASFLHLTPMLSVITNINMDHMDTYDGDFAKLLKTYVDFINCLPFYGLAVMCLDDTNVQDMIPQLTRRITTYGFDENSDVRALNARMDGLASYFTVLTQDVSFDVKLQLPGKHNVQNSLAAIAVALELGVEVKQIQKALAEFGGVGRRFEVYSDLVLADKKVTLVDDYGHHPTELQATLATARAAFPNKRLVLIFQPHRYSRTRDMFDDFVQNLSQADLLVLAPVYAAGEPSLTNFDSKALLQAMRLQGEQNLVYIEDFLQLNELVPNIIKDDDVILMMGAGDIGSWAKSWHEEGLTGE